MSVVGAFQRLPLVTALAVAACAQQSTGTSRPAPVAAPAKARIVAEVRQIVQSAGSTASAVSPTPPAPVPPTPELPHPDPPPHVTQRFPYALDDLSRRARGRRYLQCPDLKLVWYRGSVVRYQRAARVYVGFLRKLARMETIIRDTAIDFYGRPPSRIRQVGSYYCRRIRGCGGRLSEHALGNAIDIEGFDFPRISKRAAPELPDELRRPLRVRLGRHWDGGRGAAAVHSKFLRTLAVRLVEADGLFRVLLGPADRTHRNHFHFDAAPRRVVDIFEEDEPGARRLRGVVQDPGCRE